MAANPRALAKALINANPTPSNMPVGGGVFGGAPSTLPSGAVSPLVASYDAWTSGRSYGTGLPRDWWSFLSGSFGPLAPIEPVSIDTPDPATGRPDPRRWSYQVGWNMPIGPPGSEGLKLASFAQLRTIADTYSVARACIDLRKQELVGLEWDIIPTKAAEKKMRGDKDARKEWDARRAKVMRFFRRPDANYFSFASWFNACLEDVLAIDALSLYMHPPRVAGKGVMGSNLAALEIVDGSTIRPLVDVQGGKPSPPNPAFQQYIWGVPRVDLMAIMSGEDIAEMGDALYREYSGDQLMYLPYDARDWTPYGFACVEKALVPILSGLNRQNYQLEYFSEGSVPGLFISSGDANSTPQQIRELQDALNAMAGDPAWKHKIIVLPQGSRIDPQRPASLADQFDEMVMGQVCMGFGVMPMELGVMPRASSSGHSGGAANQMAKSSQDTMKRKANIPLLKRFMEIFDFVIQVTFDQEDMRFMFEGLEENEDEQTLVNILVNEISHGLKSIDEARIARGEQPWGLPITSDPVLMTPTGIIPIGGLDPKTGQLPPPPTPPGMEGVPGLPPGTTDLPGGPPAPPAPQPAAEGGGSGTTPAHAAATTDTSPGGDTAAGAAKAVNTHAALRELGLIRKRLEKGRSLDDWTPEHIPGDVFITLTDLASVEAAKTLVRSLDPTLAAKRFDPLEPRDNHGRWTIMGAVEDALKRVGHDIRPTHLDNHSTPHEQFERGRWRRVTQDSERAAAEAEIRAHLDSPEMAGWRAQQTPQQIDDAVRQTVDMMVGPPRESDRTIYANGPHQIIVPRDMAAEIPTEHVASVLDDLITRHPKHDGGRVVVNFRPADAHDDTEVMGMESQRMASTTVGGNTLMFTSHIVDPKANGDAGPLHGTMPMRREVPGWLWVLAHEYGHASYPGTHEDTGPIWEAAHEAAALDTNATGMSEYGLFGGPHEMYSEAFAEWYLSGGRTTNPYAQAFARRFGWDDHHR